MSDIPYNVLSNGGLTQDAIEQTASMINNSGLNRSQRRRLEKAVVRTTKLSQKTQKKINERIYKEYIDAVDTNFVHFFSALALTMAEDYHWKEDDTHDQISSMLERVNKKIEKYAAQGCSTEDLVQLVEDKTGLVLVPNEH